MKGLLQHQAQNLAAFLPPLLLEAERIAAAINPGVHGRRRAGMGESFWQFRRYAPGDPAARIDWRQSARTDKFFIREREWEAAQSAYLWADTSGSMRYRSRAEIPLKARRAQVLLLALASLLLRGGEKPIWLASEPVSVTGQAGLERVVAQIETEREGANLPPPLPLPHHAHMVLASDFLSAPEDLHKLMQQYTALNLRGVFLHILDPIEENFVFEGRLEMLGCENEKSFLVPNAGVLRDLYRTRMNEHKARLMRFAESAGWFYISHNTSEMPHVPLVRLYQLLSAGWDAR